MLEIDIADEFEDEIEDIVNVQKEENREAVFFIYDDYTTSDIYKGKATNIDLSKDTEKFIRSQGEIIGSVHTHPTGYDPSTIDIMTGLVSNQKYMSVATPIYDDEIQGDYVLTVMDLSEMPLQQRFRMIRSMRRSSIGITELGRRLRKEVNMQRFDMKGYRTHRVEVDGIEFPIYERPSVFNAKLGDDVKVHPNKEKHRYI